MIERHALRFAQYLSTLDPLNGNAWTVHRMWSLCACYASEPSAGFHVDRTPECTGYATPDGGIEIELELPFALR
jgi:hypothetical protein